MFFSLFTDTWKSLNGVSLQNAVRMEGGAMVMVVVARASVDVKGTRVVHPVRLAARVGFPRPLSHLYKVFILAV